MQRKDWEKGQSEFKGILDPIKENLNQLDKQVRSLEAKREGAYKSLEKELEQIIKAKTNEQLNQFSNLFLNKIKKDMIINEL